MFNSPFDGALQSERNFKSETRFIFVSDLFVEDYVGGAELTSQALIDSCPLPIETIKSKDVNLKSLEAGHDKFWVFGNFSGMNTELIPTIVANMEYAVLEYDYKYCKYRSIEKHKEAELRDCDCHNDITGKMISAFYQGAKSLWWMSEGQMDHYHNLFPFLSEKENVVLSSVFDDNFFYHVKVLREKYKDHDRSGWIVLGSNSWIKGASAAEEWCKENNKKYEVLWGLPYTDVLEKLAQAEGFVYLPLGNDTCPRMVIEAKLLGCDLHLNEFVQHKNEIWFDTEDMFDTEAYLYAARSRFWNALRATMEYQPTISGYTTTMNCIKQEYPFRQCIKSMLGFSNEVIVVDGGSDDGTWEELVRMSKEDERIIPIQNKINFEDPRFAYKSDGMQKAYARSKCSKDFCWQMDCDEVVHEDHYDKVIELCRNFPDNVTLISLPVVEFWGGPEKVRMDINPWKWRLSKNLDHITHGIPGTLRKTDENGEIYAMQGTDGCDYIHTETLDHIPHASFYSQEAHNTKIAANAGDLDAKNAYEQWFNNVVDQLPCVYHYSWFDLKRKIRTYKNFWSKFWQSLYNIEQEDTPKNNMFFDKKWTDVTDGEIDALADKLKEEMGGWIFHQKIDFTKPTQHITVNKKQPALMLNDE